MKRCPAADSGSAAREQVLPHIKPDVLRYSVINGQRRVSRSLFDEVFASAFASTASITKTLGETGLVISINDTEPERISISYTYSRPASKAEGGDKLFTPDRPKEDAKVIPEAFFEELAELGELEQPFKEIFDAKEARDDKLLSWLMRSVRLSDNDLAKLPKRVGLLGDAAHAVPIVVSLRAGRASRSRVLKLKTILLHRLEKEATTPSWMGCSLPPSSKRTSTRATVVPCRQLHLDGGKG